MKNLTRLLLVVFIVSSCAVNHDVTNGSWIQKRKYTKGFHLSTKTDHNKKNKVDKKDDTEEHIAVNSESENERTYKNVVPKNEVEKSYSIENSEKVDNELLDNDKTVKSKNKLKETPVIDNQSEAMVSVKEDSQVDNKNETLRDKMIDKYKSIYGISDVSESDVDSDVLLIIGIIICLIGLSPLGVFIVKGSGNDFTLNLLIWLVAIALFILRGIFWTGVGLGLYGGLAGLVMLFAIVHGILVILDII